jgi:hypothetical protein
MNREGDRLAVDMGDPTLEKEVTVAVTQLME